MLDCRPGGTAAFFPLTHALVGWCVAHLGRPDRATRLWCLLASLAPDLDGLTMLLGHDAYGNYHHLLLHNVTFGAVVTAVSARWIGFRAGPLAFVFAAFASHLAGDYCGSGPWPLWPWQPFSSAIYFCEGWWDVVSWQNTVITAAAIVVTLLIAARRGYSPLEFVHRGAERVLVETVELRARRTPCGTCGERAQLRCPSCNAAMCSAHAEPGRRLRPRCVLCAAPASPVAVTGRQE